MVVCKMKDEYKGIPIIKFVELKSKVNCIFSDDGEESETARGVNTAIELKEYEDNLLKKKLSDTKLKEFKVKNMKLVYMKSRKYHYCFSMTKNLF